VFGAEHKLVERTDRTYRTILAGIGYQKLFSNGTALRIMLQLDLPEIAEKTFHAGTELAFSRYVALRIGIDDNAFTFGMGFNINAFDLDYGFYNKDVAGSSHPVSFSTRWGMTLFEQRTRIAEERAREERELVQNVLTERVTPHRELALQYEAEGNIPLALDEWKIVLEYLPGDTEALEHIDEAQRVMVHEQERASRDLEKQTRISSHFTRGLDFYSGNDYTRARTEWRAILALDSTHAEASDYLERTQDKIEELLRGHHNAAVRYEREGRLTEAISEWNNIALLDPNDSRVEPAINRIKQRIENQNRDFRVTSQQLKIVNLYNHALQEYNRGEYSIAMSDLNELLELEPDHVEAKKLMTLAKRKLTPLTRQEEETIRRLYLRGMQFYTQNEFREAITEWEKILEIDPGNESVKRNIEEAKERIRKLGNNL
jgi:tetratricopeptide (TPR) repeat protein